MKYSSAESCRFWSVKDAGRRSWRKEIHVGILILFLLLILELLLPIPANASWRDDLPDDLRLSGRFFMSQGFTFERPGIPSSSFTQSNIRIDGRYRFNRDWRLEFAWQVDGMYNENLALMQAVNQGGGSDGILGLNWDIDRHTNWSANHSFDRFRLTYRKGELSADIGRQRIAWGSINLISFLDAFHPLMPGNPFVQEQPGTDAVRVQYATGMVSGFDVLYAWFDDEGDEAFAAKYHDTFGRFESGLSAGRLRDDDFIAFETSGDVDDIGLRVEAAWRDSDRGEPFQAALESDYAPNRITYLSAEVFYNGPGADDVMKYDIQSLLEGEPYPARWYAATYCTYRPSGLDTLSFTGIFNLSDDSWFTDISVLHSLTAETDLQAGYQHYGGDTISEYGALPDIVYMIYTTYF